MALNQRTVPYTVKVDKTAPVVLVTGVRDGAAYEVGALPTAACSTSNALSGVVTQATLSLTGGNADGSGTFTATCSGATDLAGNRAASVSVNYTVAAPTETPTNTPVPPTETPTNTPVPPTETPTNTPIPPTETPTNTPVPPTETPTNTPVPPTETPTNTPVPPTETPTNTPVPPTETPTNTPFPPTPTNTPVADSCLMMALRDDFNRPIRISRPPLPMATS